MWVCFSPEKDGVATGDKKMEAERFLVFFFASSKTGFNVGDACAYMLIKIVVECFSDRHGWRDLLIGPKTA
jgi:hypothetical protein